MSNLAYLALALAISIIGALILWYRHRKPRSLEAGIEDFARELRALSPERRPSGGRSDERGEKAT